ncbi:MAG: hypothetical protein WAP51_03400 [Candidatus Sungiibacteriota bacterium]
MKYFKTHVIGIVFSDGTKERFTLREGTDYVLVNGDVGMSGARLGADDIEKALKNRESILLEIRPHMCNHKSPYAKSVFINFANVAMVQITHKLRHFFTLWNTALNSVEDVLGIRLRFRYTA